VQLEKKINQLLSTSPQSYTLSDHYSSL